MCWFYSTSCVDAPFWYLFYRLLGASSAYGSGPSVTKAGPLTLIQTSGLTTGQIFEVIYAGLRECSGKAGEGLGAPLECRGEEKQHLLSPLHQPSSPSQPSALADNHLFVSFGSF